MALKRPNPQSCDRETLRRQFKREGEIWMKLQHPNIAYLFAIFEPVNPRWGEVMLISPWAELGTATKYLQQFENNNHTPGIIGDIIEYMHSEDVLTYHGDLKGNNVLLFEGSDRPIAKLTDFGLSKICAPTPIAASRVGGNAYWMSPEVRFAREALLSADTAEIPELVLTAQADVWSLGMTIFELMTRSENPMRDRSTDSVTKLLKGSAQAIDAELHDYLLCLPDAFQPLLRSLLAADPDRRPNMTMVKSTWQRIIREQDEIGQWSTILSCVQPPFCHYYPAVSESTTDCFESWRKWMEQRRQMRRVSN
ncbi:kinase-like protein [Sistotremastrum suecicum HHB10207 ss-3]|uniref:Kinase-like protein n=1 Tax=Sistotremastrum suecicum HHB10207 ss-3 TaxID=1314776 RepID=A0A166EFG7_9AGAM|nr:kinase-like protein [Sistotremastrum suecicum HHB10207 ss-3]